jgi:SnoaL-like domain
MDIEDEHAIGAVLLRYATGIDRRDWVLFATCFTDDVQADYGALGQWHGRDSLVAHMAQGHADLGPTLHRMSNFVITGVAHEARATSYVDALLMHKSGQVLRRAHGYYEDRLVRAEGAWKISSRHFLAVLIEPAL